MNSKGKGKTWFFAAAFLLAGYGLAVAAENTPATATEQAAPVQQVAPAADAVAPATEAAQTEAVAAASGPVTISIDTNTINNGGTIKVIG